MDFHYKAKNQKGEIKEGEFSYQEKKQVYDQLREGGYVLISLEKISKNSSRGLFLEKISEKFSRISLEDKMIFTRHLAVMIGAGLALPRSLDILKNQARTNKFKNIIEEIAGEIKKGKSLASSFEKFPGVFGTLYSNMIKAGEEGGNLQEILELLAEHMEKENSLRAKVKGALIYPALILVVMAGIAAAMMTMVVPKLAAIFFDMGVKLPFATKILIKISIWAKENFAALLTDFLILAVLIRIVCLFDAVKKIFHFLQLRVPFLGKFYKKINAARFARVASSLINAGIPVSESLKITSGTLPNIYYKESLLLAAKDVQSGKTLQDSLARFDFLYPLLITQMIEIGEETGNSGNILAKLADFYQEDIDNAAKNISSIIEPVLMIVIGFFVGFFALSIMMPMYSILGSV